MQDEAKQRFKEFRLQQGRVLIDIFENLAEKIENQYGKDIAIGFVLGMDTAYLAVTGEEMAAAMNERKQEQNE